MEEGVFPIVAQQLVNTWPCSGVQDATGTLKPEMAAIGLPEPALGASLALGTALLMSLARLRDKRAE